MAAPLDVVGIEDGLARAAEQHGGELPAQIGRVTDAGIHALAEKRWLQMSCVAGQEHTAGAKRSATREWC